MQKKAIGLLSGGLDSTVAVKMIQEQGIEVIAVNFMSPFCTCTAKSAGCKSEALKVSKSLGLKIKYVFLGEEYLKMIKNPRHGYGRGMNPCVDCRIMMFGKAREMMKELGASFVFTGEVLGQRPMSQRKDTMRLIEKESGLDGYILRPLCAGLLTETIPEKEGIVDREKLLKIRGRSRKDQMKLADDYGINDYPCSSGGCLLTERGFAGKVKDLFDHSGAPSAKDARLLRIGRHFRISDNLRLVVGRDKMENDQLEKMIEPGDFQFTLADFKGPLAVARGEAEDEQVQIISGILTRYGTVPQGVEAAVVYIRAGEDGEKICRTEAMDEALVENFRVKGLGES